MERILNAWGRIYKSNMAIFRQLLNDVRRVYQQIIAIVCGWNWLGSIVHVIIALYKLLILGTIFLAIWSTIVGYHFRRISYLQEIIVMYHGRARQRSFHVWCGFVITITMFIYTMLRSSPVSQWEICHYSALTYGSVQKLRDIKTLSLFHSRLVGMQENSASHHTF